MRPATSVAPARTFHRAAQYVQGGHGQTLYINAACGPPPAPEQTSKGQVFPPSARPAAKTRTAS